MVRDGKGQEVFTSKDEKQALNQLIKDIKNMVDRITTVDAVIYPDPKPVPLQIAVTAVGNGTPFDVGIRKVLTLRISGTSTSRTIAFEISMDGTNWEPTTGVKFSDMSFAAQTTGNNETWSFEVPGVKSFRARVVAVAGGNVTVSGTAVV